MIFLLFLWGLSICVNIGSTKIATYRSMLLPSNSKPLPDVCLEILPVFPDWIPDAFILCVFLIDVLLPFQFENFLIASSYAMFIRSITTWVTIFPTPLLSVSTLGYGQHDLMFSGHTIMLFSSAHTYLGYIIASLGAISILCARQHYTIDVLIAIIIVELLKIKI